MFEVWMTIKEIVLVVGLSIMSIEDIRRKEIRRIWLTGLGLVGIVIAIAAGDIDGAQYLFRLVPGIVCFLVAWVTGEQIGFGDAFLIFIMGLYCNVTELINVCMFTCFSFSGRINTAFLSSPIKSRLIRVNSSYVGSLTI